VPRRLQTGVFRRARAKENLVLRVILLEEGGQMSGELRLVAMHGFEQRERRRKAGCSARLASACRRSRR